MIDVQKGCKAVDAPVSGGDMGARNGKLSIMCGGDAAVVAALSPLFAPMGQVGQRSILPIKCRNIV